MVVSTETETEPVAETAAVPRDTSQVRAADWPLRPSSGRSRGGRSASRSLFASRFSTTSAAHGKSREEIEVCGVLVGNIYSDGEAPYCYIDGNIRGNYAAGRSTQVTFTSETWTHINDIRDRDHPNQKIVGWYHTHPGFGIFLSEMDLFIHENFFPEPWQLAFVYDPKSGEDGMFEWRKGKAVPDNFLVEHDTNAPIEAAAQPVQAAPSGTVGELSARLQALEQKSRWLLASLALCALVAIAWPLIVFLVLPGAIGPLMGHGGETIRKPVPARSIAPAAGVPFDGSQPRNTR